MAFFSKKYPLGNSKACNTVSLFVTTIMFQKIFDCPDLGLRECRNIIYNCLLKYMLCSDFSVHVRGLIW